MTPTPATYKGVIAEFQRQPKGVQDYFGHLPGLITTFDFDVAIAYAHSQVELCHNMLLYCGLAKLHRADTAVAGRVVEANHLTRETFQKLFDNIFGKPITPAIQKLLEGAERVRDKIMHGKSIAEEKKRGALVDVLNYASALNTFVYAAAGFSPFSDLRGVKGAAKAIDGSTTRWLLKGMGFSC